jgi:hypothetical protein
MPMVEPCEQFSELGTNTTSASQPRLRSAREVRDLALATETTLSNDAMLWLVTGIDAW